MPIRIVGLIALLSVALVHVSGAQNDESNAIQEIESIQDTYFQSISEINIDLLLTIWDDPADMSAVTPLERLQSLEELEGFFQGLGETYSEVEVLRSNVDIHIEGTAGWAAMDYVVDGVLLDGQSVQFNGWETQIYSRTDDG